MSKTQMRLAVKGVDLSWADSQSKSYLEGRVVGGLAWIYQHLR